MERCRKPPVYEDGTECSETSAHKIQTPGNNPEESIEHLEHGESLKSRISTGNYEMYYHMRQTNSAVLLLLVSASKACLIYWSE